MWKGLCSCCLSYAVLAPNTNLSSALIIQHLSQTLHSLLGSRSKRKETHTVHSIRFTFFFGVAIFTHYDSFKSKVFYNAFRNCHCASTGFTEVNYTEEKKTSYQTKKPHKQTNKQKSRSNIFNTRTNVLK